MVKAISRRNTFSSNSIQTISYGNLSWKRRFHGNFLNLTRMFRNCAQKISPLSEHSSKLNYNITCHEYFWWRRQSLVEALFRQIPSGQFRMETFHGKDDWSWHLPIAQGCWLRQTHCPRCNVQNPAAAVEYSCKIKFLALLKRKAIEICTNPDAIKLPVHC